ncbi:recombinase family protein [Corticicoccus populi]|uniref:Recombinase family protein n=1 Tax=Corticicoccus populi TaxID=1812821 RepID=A0ABW5WVR4_9STAP
MDLNKIVSTLNEKGVSVCFIQDNLTFEAGNNSPMNALIFNMLGSFAQFERDLIIQRASEVRERVKKQGKTPR